jgi:hypothetical protein
LEDIEMKKNFLATITFLLAFFLAAGQAFAVSDLAYLAEISGTSFLPSAIRAGDIASMAVNIHNRGTVYSIVDLNATLDVGTNFSPVELNSNVPLIPADATGTLIFKFRANTGTVAGYYPVFMTMNYLRNGQLVTETQSLTVPVSRTEKNIDVTAEPRVINPGNQTTLTFSLNNVSGAPISNLSVSWDEKNDLILPVGSDNKRYISLLQPGTVEKVDYIVAADPNITPGIYPIDVNLSFTDSNSIRSQVSQLGLIVGGTTDFEVSAETLSTGQLSVSIANIGSNNASAVVVKIPQQPGVRVSGSSISILGALNKGDYTIATFQVTTTVQSDQNNSGARRQPGQNAGGNATTSQQQTAMPNFGDFNRQQSGNNMQIEIDYTDTTGERQSVRKTIQLASSSSTTFGSASGFQTRQSNQLPLLPIGLFVVIVAVSGYYNHKKNRIAWKQFAIAAVISAIVFLAAIFLFNQQLWATVAAALVSVAVLVFFFRKATGKATERKRRQ